MKTFGKLQAGLIFLTLVSMTPALEVDGAWWLMLLALFSALGGLSLAKPGGGVSRTSIEMGLTGVLATQLWHHLYLSGDLCDLASKVPDVPRSPKAAQADTAPVPVGS